MHALGAFYAGLADGSQPFAQYSAGFVLGELKTWLECLRVPSAVAYRTQDFRRGHARDLQQSDERMLPTEAIHVSIASGSGLYEILKAGEWRSPAFLEVSWERVLVHGLQFGVLLREYLSRDDLENGAVLEAHLDESSGGEDPC